MTAEMIITVVVAVLGSNLIQFFITRSDNKKRIADELDELEGKLMELKLDHSKTHMLLLLSDYVSERAEVMKAADEYFRELKGNSYVSSLFAKWLDKHDIPKPLWFNGGEY